MRIIARAVLAVLLLLGPAVATALAVTTAQLVELTRAGLSDDVLIALIQTDGSSFQLSANDILSLHKAGLSNAVILAMQRTVLKKERPARTIDPELVAASAAEPSPIVQEQVVQPGGATPAVINVVRTVAQRVTASPAIVPVMPFAVPIVVSPQGVTKPAPPEYWGWNGQRRPDTWPDAPPPDPTSARTVVPAKKIGGS